jgi:hypothetical protein
MVKGFLSLLQNPGEGPLSLAVCDRWHRPADIGAAIDAVGGYRLATSGLDICADTGGVEQTSIFTVR